MFNNNPSITNKINGVLANDTPQNVKHQEIQAILKEFIGEVSLVECHDNMYELFDGWMRTELANDQTGRHLMYCFFEKVIGIINAIKCRLD